MAIAAAGTVVVATAGGSTPAPAPATSGPTAVIAIRDLVQTNDQPGTLGYTDTRSVYNQLSGTVTWVPQAGSVIGADGVLYRVDGSGVYLFDGEIPMYRSFTSGMTDGRDVGELNRDLHAMRYDSGEAIDVSNVDHFQTATGDAIDRWQKAHGLDQTGELDLGRVVFLPGARRIETVELSVGGPATSSANAGGPTGTAASNEQTGAVQTVAVSFVRATSTSSTPTTTTPSTSTSSTTTPTTSITTTTATKLTMATVPNVTGDRAPAATGALIAARFTVAEKTKTVTDKGQNGVVLDQRPAGGSTINQGSAVTITVGRYKPQSQTSIGTSTRRTSTQSSPTLSGGGGLGAIAAGGARGAGGSGASASGAGTTASGSGATGGSGAGAGVAGVADVAGGAGDSGAVASSGSTPSPAANVALVTTSTDSVVTVQLDASRQTEAVVGERV
ncbi:MAG: PASTA domain-containing protein, partial [Solirubrobacterales bacterium]|nr:PASTA domain-containing protein [Solirubrobacterales bacterium]